ncbi:MAG: DinB family protein [Deltaproteobacteria bacterium]|nr:DinB family protein [Deltaproteobacteria bacterium]
MNAVPKLAAPGAGLPALELCFSKILLKLFLLGNSNKAFIVKALREKALTLHLLEGVLPAQRNVQVLIPRLMGMEDSSRNWSVAMTLQHLVTTTEGMVAIAKELTQGKQPKIEVKIENVKPADSIESGVERRYSESVDRLVSFAGERDSLKTTLTHPHPWFGPLDGHGWIGLACLHLGIHRRQIASTLALLPRHQ